MEQLVLKLLDPRSGSIVSLSTNSNTSNKIVSKLKGIGVKDAFIARKGMVQVFTMNKIPMIIMAAGVSSRMKDSSVPKNFSKFNNQSNERVKVLFKQVKEMSEIVTYNKKLYKHRCKELLYFIDNSDEFQDYLKN